MNRIQLLWVMYEAIPGGLASTRARFQEVCGVLDRILLTLESHPLARIACYLTGATLERLQTEDDLVDRMRVAAGRGQLELLAGGYLAPILAAIPEADAYSQLHHSARLIRAITQSQARGVWLSQQVWEPPLATLLAGSGFEYTFLENRQLSITLSPSVYPDGVWTVEHLGFLVRVLGIDQVLSGLLHGMAVSELEEYLAQRLSESTQPVCLGTSIEGLIHNEAQREHFGSFASRLAELGHWLSMELPETVVARQRPRGRIDIPASMPPEMAEMALSPGALAEGLREIISYQEKGEAGPAFLDHAATSWMFFLGRYPEINLLHKKMLLTSGRVQKMARVVRERYAAGQDVTVFAKAVRRARDALFASQSHAAYWAGIRGGIYHPEIRKAALARLLEAQRIADGLFFPEPRYVAFQLVDLDRDGFEEILVSTPKLEFGFSVIGGAAFEIGLKSDLSPLMAAVVRRPERVHERLRQPGVLLPKRKKKRIVSEPPAPGSEWLVPHVRYDHYPHWSFLDHILGEAACVDNFYQCQYPEEGDFLDGEYELIHHSYDRKAGSGTLHLSRNGWVGQKPDSEGAPLRLEKVFTFDDRGGILSVQYSFTNRSHTPIAFRLGIELCFGAGVELLALESFEEGKPCPVPEKDSRGSVLKGETLGVAGLVLSIPDSEARAKLQMDAPARLWWYPLETVTDEGGRTVLRNQGIVLMPIWDISLWGEETRVQNVEFRILEPAAEAAPVIVDDEE